MKTARSFDEGRIKLTHQGLRARFGNLQRTRVALESGTYSLRVVPTLLTELGHEVIVANTRQVTAIRVAQQSDRNDAVKLARYARVDPSILCPIQHRSADAQVELSLIRARAPGSRELPANSADRRSSAALANNHRRLWLGK
jgi:transposase